jgi:hypothetical protein
MDQMDSFAAHLRNMDPAVFTATSQTRIGDRRSLLAVQNIVRNVRPRYVYFEVGSHLGGTLVPHLVDPLCRHVFSIDKRPANQPDERGAMFDYKENLTSRMLEALAPHVPPSAFLKLTTCDADVSEVNASQVPMKVDFAFIDAEHTNVAVFRDFLGTTDFLAESFVVAFHDANLICDGLQNIECFLWHQGIKFRSFFLPDVMYAIMTGDFAEVAGQALQRISVDREKFIQQSRISLWKEIANNVSRVEGDAVAHQIASCARNS